MNLNASKLNSPIILIDPTYKQRNTLAALSNETFENFKKDYTGKNILIFGLGSQGRGVGDTRIFHQIGAKITVTDAKSDDQLEDALLKLRDLDGITYHLGGHFESDIQKTDVVIRNASIPWDHPLLNSPSP